ncbi:hypothetical protein ACEQ8H_004463 [Pleosporales sp. CAS-2024a]
MAQNVSGSAIPVPEPKLRDLAKNVTGSLRNLAEKDPATGGKEIHDLIDPILETADLQELSPGHRAAASNAICAIIEYCHASSATYAREEVLKDSIWLRTFDLYLQRSEQAKGKSMRQILLVLTSVITKDHYERTIDLRRRAATIFLDIICGRQDRLKVKPALQGLAHFLLRDVVSITELLAFHEGRTGADNVSTPQTLFEAFLAWIVHHDTSLSAGHLIKNFLIQARKSPVYLTTDGDAFISPLWIQPVVATLHDWPDRMQEFKTHVFPHCFLPNSEEYMRFLSYLHFSTHVQSSTAVPLVLRVLDNRSNGIDACEEFRILAAAIEAGKELSIIRDTDSRAYPNIEVQNGTIEIPDTIFGSWMSHPDPEVRLAGMFLSVHSNSITRPMTSGTLRLLKVNLVHLHTDTDAYFRRDINGYTQKMFDRLRASTATLAKGLLDETLSFITWYIKFMQWELRSTASYQRRITALQSLIIVLRSGIDPGVPPLHLSKSAQGQLNWAHGLQIASPTLTRVLMDLILDPFDDIRSLAVSVLQICVLAQPVADQDTVLASVHSFLQRAESMQLRTGRADQADGVARAYSLMYSLLDSYSGVKNPTAFPSSLAVLLSLRQTLQTTISFAEHNLLEAVNGQPVHATFAALRYILDQEPIYSSLSKLPDEAFSQWKTAHGDLFECITNFWACIQHILCADAPEGLVPDEIEEEASLDTKEILSYSWRGVKEASMLLRVMITKAPIGDDKSALISPALFEKLGRLCFNQLLELRHRGAFSTVSQTFAAFCRRCVSSQIPELRALPEMWYQETLLSIQDKAGAITRRSAGIPALMASITAADANKLFPRAMRDLISEASVEAQSMNIEESRLPQVHALNCIKEFFTTSRLNVISEAYMGQGLELAAKMLNSDMLEWPIRNGSLMLFKALIERLLGSSEAQDWKELERARTSRFSYDDYPSLIGILSDLLNPEGPLKQSIETTPDSSSPLDLHGAEGVFPALQILRQARPPQAHIQAILQSVGKLLSSPHWHLRDMAARTIISLQTTDQLHDAFLALLSPRPVSHNLQHGTLLTVKYMVRKLVRNQNTLELDTFKSLMLEMTSAAKQWYIPSRCPFVRAVFLDVIGLCGMAMVRRSDAVSALPGWEALTAAVSFGPHYALGVSAAAGHALLRQSLANVFFIDRLIVRGNNTSQMASHGLQDIGEALLLLADKDQDTFCGALDTLGRLLRLDSSNGITAPLELLMAAIHNVLLHATDAEVISKAQAVLATGLDNSNLKTRFFNLLTKDQTMLTLVKLEDQCLDGPPSNLQSALHLFGHLLDHAYAAYTSQHRDLLGAIARYIRLLRMSITDTNPFDTRFAAARSLTALHHTWLMSPACKTTAPLILGLSFILDDLLNDDDDEIRRLAASTTSTFLHAQQQIQIQTQKTPTTQGRAHLQMMHTQTTNGILTTPTVPLLSTHRLASFLAHTFPHSKHLMRESTRRLLPLLLIINPTTTTSTTTTTTTTTITPFAAQLATANRDSTALFATEKQNLYRDATLDALLHARILARARLSLCAHGHVKRRVVEALAVLGRMAAAAAGEERDGPLGWASKPEVFALGMRVFCAAEVVVDDGEVMVGLARVAHVLREKGGHGLWVERVERILEKGVVGLLRRVKASWEERLVL